MSFPVAGYHAPVKIGIEGQEKTVFVGGFIDRIDRTDQGIRVIDYKTGADTTAFKTIASVFDPANPTRNKAAFQTMVYCLMYDHVHPSEQPLIPGIYSTKLLFGKDYDFRLKCDKELIQKNYSPRNILFAKPITKRNAGLAVMPEYAADKNEKGHRLAVVFHFVIHCFSSF